MTWYESLRGSAAAQCGKPPAYRLSLLLFLFHPEAEPQDENAKRILRLERRSLSALCGGRAAKRLMHSMREYFEARIVRGLAMLALACLISPAAAFAQKRAATRKPRTTQPRATSELEKLRKQYIETTKEYKASLEKLLALYQASVRKAQDHLVKSKQLFSEGLISKNQLDETLPIAVFGQGAIHDRWRLDHHNAMDVSLNPDGPEGQALMEFLRGNGIRWIRRPIRALNVWPTR